MTKKIIPLLFPEGLLTSPQAIDALLRAAGRTEGYGLGPNEQYRPDEQAIVDAFAKTMMATPTAAAVFKFEQVIIEGEAEPYFSLSREDSLACVYLHTVWVERPTASLERLLSLAGTPPSGWMRSLQVIDGDLAQVEQQSMFDWLRAHAKPETIPALVETISTTVSEWLGLRMLKSNSIVFTTQRERFPVREQAGLAKQDMGIISLQFYNEGVSHDVVGEVDFYTAWESNPMGACEVIVHAEKYLGSTYNGLALPNPRSVRALEYFLKQEYAHAPAIKKAIENDISAVARKHFGENFEPSRELLGMQFQFSRYDSPTVDTPGKVYLYMLLPLDGLWTTVMRWTIATKWKMITNTRFQETFDALTAENIEHYVTAVNATDKAGWHRYIEAYGTYYSHTTILDELAQHMARNMSARVQDLLRQVTTGGVDTKMADHLEYRMWRAWEPSEGKSGLIAIDLRHGFTKLGEIRFWTTLIDPTIQERNSEARETISPDMIEQIVELDYRPYERKPAANQGPRHEQQQGDRFNRWGGHPHPGGNPWNQGQQQPHWPYGGFQQHSPYGGGYHGGTYCPPYGPTHGVGGFQAAPVPTREFQYSGTNKVLFKGLARAMAFANARSDALEKHVEAAIREIDTPQFDQPNVFYQMFLVPNAAGFVMRVVSENGIVLYQQLILFSF